MRENSAVLIFEKDQQINQNKLWCARRRMITLKLIFWLITAMKYNLVNCIKKKIFLSTYYLFLVLFHESYRIRFIYFNIRFYLLNKYNGFNIMKSIYIIILHDIHCLPLSSSDKDVYLVSLFFMLRKLIYIINFISRNNIAKKFNDGATWWGTFSRRYCIHWQLGNNY